MKEPVIFEHIPKTGGMSLRGVFQKVYGKPAVFSILFDDLMESLQTFQNLSVEQRSQLQVIAGHGAGLFAPLFDRSFKVTVLREPVSMFISQFFFLKNSPHIKFYDDLKNMESLEEYIPYALEHGQDNLMTRFLSGSIQFLMDQNIPVPDLANRGEDLLNKAKAALNEYDAVFDLQHFDAGVFTLSRQLGWKGGVPLYFPQNRTRKKPILIPTAGLRKKLENTLSCDLALYDYFIQNKIDITHNTDLSSKDYQLFQYRQRMLNQLKRVLK